MDDLYVACMASVVLSTKTCNLKRSLNENGDFCKNLLQVLSKRNITIFGRTLNMSFINKKSADLEEFTFGLNEKIFYLEFDILSKIGFDLNLDLPFKYIDKMSVYLKRNLPQYETQLTKIALAFMDEFYFLPLCLNYEPLYIVLTCYNLITKNCNITFPNLPNGKKWYEIFLTDSNNVTKKMAEYGKQISIILTTVKEHKNNKNQNKEKENIILTFYKNNEKKSNNSSLASLASTEDSDLHNDIIKYNENKDNEMLKFENKERTCNNTYNENKSCGSLLNLKSTHSEKVTVDSDSNLYEQAFS